MNAPAPTTGRRGRRRNDPRRYGRATLRTGQVEVLLAIALGVALLVGLAVVALPSPTSTVVAVALVVGGVALAAYDRRRAQA